MENSKKWSAKDVITSILFSVLMIAVHLILNMVSSINNFTSMVLGTGIITFALAPIYFLMVSKINKRFVTFVYMTLLGIVLLLMGNWFLLPWFLFVGIICETILWKKGSCKNSKKVTLSCITYSILFLGMNFIPIWFFWETFETNALAMGMTQEYLESYVSYYQSTPWIIAIIAITFALAFCGCLIGKSLLNKHFKKAGVL